MKSYENNSELGSTIISRQIGNAVPPIFAEVLGKEIIKNIKNNKECKVGKELFIRNYKI